MDELTEEVDIYIDLCKVKKRDIHTSFKYK